MKKTDIDLRGYFEFLDNDDIRVKGTRVGIEIILEDYLNAFSPEEIAIRYPTLNLEQVYATITYYFHNKARIDAYLKRWRKYSEESRLAQIRNPTPAVRRLQDLKRRRSKIMNESSA